MSIGLDMGVTEAEREAIEVWKQRLSVLTRAEKIELANGIMDEQIGRAMTDDQRAKLAKLVEDGMTPQERMWNQW